MDVGVLMVLLKFVLLVQLIKLVYLLCCRLVAVRGREGAPYIILPPGADDVSK